MTAPAGYYDEYDEYDDYGNDDFDEFGNVPHSDLLDRGKGEEGGVRPGRFRTDDPPPQSPPPPDNSQTALSLEDMRTAATKGSVESLRKCVEGDMEVDVCLSTGWTALMHAASANQSEAVQFLLSKGANPNFDRDMFTPLMATCSSRGHGGGDRNLECVRFLTEKGARVRAHDRSRMTSLMYASREGKLPIVRYLLENGAEPNRQDAGGWTALAFSSSHGHMQVVHCLLDCQAEPKLACYDGQLPADLAFVSGHEQIVELLTGSGGGNSVAAASSKSAPATSHSQNVNVQYGDLELFLCSLNLGHLICFFHKHEVDFAMTLRLTEADLEKMGVTEVGVRQKIVNGIKQVHMKEWDASNLDEQLTTKIGPKEVQLIFENLAKHCRYLNSSICYVVSQMPEKMGGDMLVALDAASAGIQELQMSMMEVEKKAGEAKSTAVPAKAKESCRVTANRPRSFFKVGAICVVGFGAMGYLAYRYLEK